MTKNEEAMLARDADYETFARVADYFEARVGDPDFTFDDALRVGVWMATWIEREKRALAKQLQVMATGRVRLGVSPS